MRFDSLDYVAFLLLALGGFWVLTRAGRPPAGVADSESGPPTPRDVPRSARLVWLLVASCAFYMAWNPLYIGLILFSTLLDFTVGIGIHRARASWARRAWLGASLAGNLGLLGLFKYYNFFAEASGLLLHSAFGLRLELPLLDVLLPVGISFYTFQTLSYTIDIYRRRLEPTRSLLHFACYVTFFPQLVAGPIVRASEFLPQLERPPRLDRARVSQALLLIGMGLVKKVVFADYLALNLVDRVFDDPAAFTSVEVVIGLYAFTLQIYADFSGYTDVARGSGLLFGLELPRNFDRPYLARSAAEFWRRWHMTLSTWLRDYLYFPLGGSKRGALRTYFNLWLTIFLIGLWHGASWTFVIYGNVQALAVMLNRAVRRMRRRFGFTGEDPAWANLLKVLLTLQFVVFSRILFRATSLDNAFAVTAQLFDGTTSTAQVSTDVWRVLLLGFYLHYLPTERFEHLARRFGALRPAWQGVALVAAGAVVALFASEEIVPYIYFQF